MGEHAWEGRMGCRGGDHREGGTFSVECFFEDPNATVATEPP